MVLQRGSQSHQSHQCDPSNNCGNILRMLLWWNSCLSFSVTSQEVILSEARLFPHVQGKANRLCVCVTTSLTAAVVVKAKWKQSMLGEEHQHHLHWCSLSEMQVSVNWTHGRLVWICSVNIALYKLEFCKVQQHQLRLTSFKERTKSWPGGAKTIKTNKCFIIKLGHFYLCLLLKVVFIFYETLQMVMTDDGS